VGLQQQTGAVGQLLRSFALINETPSRARRSSGNLCLHLPLDVRPSVAPLAVATVTQCQSWPVSPSADSAISVQCFSAGGQLIQCCGHGLLAAACSWQQRLERDNLWLLMNGSAVFSWREGDITWLRFDTVPTQRQPIPDWAEQILGVSQLAIASALAGDKLSYLVLQWPDGFDLTKLQRPTAALAEHTQRGLICTAAQPKWGEKIIHLRYFAPQYGVDEDAATGSAMRILADYWYPRFDQLAAYQCSEQGGWLLSQRTASHVAVGGHCVSATSEDAYA